MQVHSNAVPAPRAEKNRQFANDGSYESVERMLQKQAGACYRRVMAMGLSMTFDDVMQEMNLAYVLAREKWNPEGGVLFSTYLITCCRNNFNDRIRKAETERRNLGLVNLTDMSRVDPDQGDEGDYMETADAAPDEPTFSIGQLYGDDFVEGKTRSDVAPFHANPAELIEHVQQLQVEDAQRKQTLKALTGNAKAVMADLVAAAQQRENASEQDTQKLPKFGALLRNRGFSEAECRRIRKEILVAFGVKV